MTTYVAFLRAVNVGGTGRLTMSDLRSMCDEIGFAGIQTYIASGNLTFTSSESRVMIKSALENRLHDYAGKDVGVILRTASELRETLNSNPFPDHDPRRTLVIFLDGRPANDALDGVHGQNDEEIQIGDREIFVHYRSGIGGSKLSIPAAKSGTARNMNTVKKMVEMSSK